MKTKVIGSLVGQSVNAFALLGYFQELAEKQGFEKKWINHIVKEAMNGDYNHLLRVLSSNMEEA